MTTAQYNKTERIVAKLLDIRTALDNLSEDVTSDDGGTMLTRASENVDKAISQIWEAQKT